MPEALFRPLPIAGPTLGRNSSSWGFLGRNSNSGAEDVELLPRELQGEKLRPRGRPTRGRGLQSQKISGLRKEAPVD